MGGIKNRYFKEITEGLGKTKKVRRKTVKETHHTFEKVTCKTIKKAIQVKFMEKWVTIHTYEIETWNERL